MMQGKAQGLSVDGAAATAGGGGQVGTPTKAPVILGRLYVGGLPPSVTANEVDKLFSSLDLKVKDVQINTKNAAVTGEHAFNIKHSPFPCN